MWWLVQDVSPSLLNDSWDTLQHPRQLWAQERALIENGWMDHYWGKKNPSLNVFLCPVHLCTKCPAILKRAFMSPLMIYYWRSSCSISVTLFSGKLQFHRSVSVCFLSVCLLLIRRAAPAECKKLFAIKLRLLWEWLCCLRQSKTAGRDLIRTVQ